MMCSLHKALISTRSIKVCVAWIFYMFCQRLCVCVYLDNVSEARVFTLFALNELESLRLLAAQLGRLFLKLVSGCPFKLQTHTNCKHTEYGARKHVSTCHRDGRSKTNPGQHHIPDVLNNRRFSSLLHRLTQTRCKRETQKQQRTSKPGNV